MSQSVKSIKSLSALRSLINTLVTVQAEATKAMFVYQDTYYSMSHVGPKSNCVTILSIH
jgi:hypothetical protein